MSAFRRPWMPSARHRLLAHALISAVMVVPLAGVAATPAKLVDAVAAVPAPAAPRPPALGLIVKLKSEARPRVLAYGAAAATEQAQAEDGKAATERLAQVVAKTSVKPSHLRERGGRMHLLDFDRVLSGDEARRMADELAARPDVEWVVPNELEKLQQAVTPNDPSFPSQWWLFSGTDQAAASARRRAAPEVQPAWARDRGLNSGIVAVLDTGITSHPDLDPSHILPGRDFVSNVARAADGNGWDADPSDPGDSVTEADKATAAFKDCAVTNSSWHGTSIAGMLAMSTDNNLGGAAVSWNGRVLPVRVAGKCGASVDDIVAGMRWAAGLVVTGVPTNPNPARIINISFGGSAACNAAYQGAIDELAAAGVVVVAAAGNDHGAVSRPANCDKVVAVAALNRDGFKASYSNFGPKVTVSTVGGDPANGSTVWDVLRDTGIYTISNNGLDGPNPQGAISDYRFGTSFATPVVSGVMSLMLGVDANLTRQQLIDGVTRTARPHVLFTAGTQSTGTVCSDANPGRCRCTTSTCGAGILDADQALAYAASPTTYVAPNRSQVVIDSADLRAAIAGGQDRPANPPSSSGSSNDNGGGALGWGWLLALAAAVVVAGRRTPSFR